MLTASRMVRFSVFARARASSRDSRDHTICAAAVGATRTARRRGAFMVRLRLDGWGRGGADSDLREEQREAPASPELLAVLAMAPGLRRTASRIAPRRSQKLLALRRT